LGQVDVAHVVETFTGQSQQSPRTTPPPTPQPRTTPPPTDPWNPDPPPNLRELYDEGAFEPEYVNED